MAEPNNAPAGTKSGGSGSHGSSSSEAEDHFSDASEGRKDRSSISMIPTTRVERVDDRPAHGEVPGTEAFKIRQSDADPDELKVVPETGSGQTLHGVSNNYTSSMPGGKPIPTTVVEKVSPDIPTHGEVPGTHAYELRQADTAPDKVVDGPNVAKEELAGLPAAISSRPQIDDNDRIVSSKEMCDEQSEQHHLNENEDNLGAEDMGDSDDFEEGVGDDDFGDFNDEFENPKTNEDAKPIATVNENVNTSLPKFHLPLIDYRNLQSAKDIDSAIEPYMDELFPRLSSLKNKPLETPSASGNNNNKATVFQSERSQSLWSQLVAPPSLNPPNWIKSRTRRLFLVSLGVPVDLDEILPASKQRKLILPSMTVSFDERSPRPWAEEHGKDGAARAKQKKQSATWADSSSAKADQFKQGSAQPPDFDIGSVNIVCSIAETALNNFTDEELEAHVERLQGLQHRAGETLEFWTKRRDQAIDEKEAFEAVIENLVTHAKKARR